MRCCGAHADLQVGREAGAHRKARVLDGDLHMIGPGLGIGIARHEADGSTQHLARHQPRARRRANLEPRGLRLGRIGDHQQGVELNHRPAWLSGREIAADLGVPAIKHARERRADIHLAQGDFGGADLGLGPIEVGLGLQHLGRRTEALFGQLRGGLALQLAGLQRGAGLIQGGLAGIDGQAAQHLALAHQCTLRNGGRGDNSGGFGPDHHRASRFGAPPQ